MDANGLWYGLMHNDSGALPPAKVLVIGAGSRGNAYSRAITEQTDAEIAAVAEPIESKRMRLGRNYIWHDRGPKPYEAFVHWKQFIQYETVRRERAASGATIEKGIDAVLVCTLDEQHAEIIRSLAPLNLHVLCEKPLATTLQDCLSIYSSLLPDGPDTSPKAIFGIGHVLRYSPHNMLLRKLLLHDRAIGDIVSMEHTEPVGWWHFAHSYVRGNWRKTSSTAPSLLTKSCHDIDFILWLLCSAPSSTSEDPPHLPSKITSTGRLNYFRKSRKPRAAGQATNCLQCSAEPDCKYSAKKIYYDDRLKQGWASWPVSIVNPEIEECYRIQGLAEAEGKLFSSLSENYKTENGSPQRPFFGRCVFEADNDVCDDQFVTIEWEDDASSAVARSESDFTRHAKSATFHLIAHTQAVCERRGRIYGSNGEISYDSKTITLFDFETGTSRSYSPDQTGGGHGGGDVGLAFQFVQAVNAVRGGADTKDAQALHLGCKIEDILRSHVMVFAAEEARLESKTVKWLDWWNTQVEAKLKASSPLEEDFEFVNLSSFSPNK